MKEALPVKSSRVLSRWSLLVCALNVSACILPDSAGSHDGGPPPCPSQTLLARAGPAKPNVMMVFDSSKLAAHLFEDGGTRADGLTTELARFATQHGGQFHLSMTSFERPNAGVCAAPTLADIAAFGVELDTTIRDDDVVSLGLRAQQVAQTYAGLFSSGLSPLASTLTPLQAYAPLVDSYRPGYVVVVSQGVAECNPAAPMGRCSCTTGDCSLMSVECVDETGPTEAVAALRALDIKTAFIALNDPLARVRAPLMLAAAGDAGGVARSCTTDLDCGHNDSCTGNLTCAGSYSAVTTREELHAAFETLARSMHDGLRCTQLVPANSTGLIVYVGDQRLDPSDWFFSNGKLEVLGGGCDELKAGRPLQVCGD